MSKAKTLADLKKSGLTESDFKKLKIKVLTVKENQKLTGKVNAVPGYVMPYFDIHGKPIKNAWRRRNIEIPKGKFGGERVDPSKWRYRGPDDELPHLYFPQNFKAWPQVAKDVTEAIFITEGEKKAACMCKRGYPTIAVPGVWGWKSAKQGVRIIKDFDCIDWGNAENPRPVYMVFDNDVIIKQQVLGALNALSHELVSKSAQVFIRHLPEGNLKGADDFLVARGDDAFDALADTDTEFAQSAAIWDMQETVAYIMSHNYFVDVKNFRTFPDTAKLKQAFGNVLYWTTNANGDAVQKPVVEEWLKLPQRRTHSAMTYAPAKPVVVGDKLNTWPGWGAKPKTGNVKPFIKLIDYLFQDETPAVKKWFWQWLAYPIQQPGEKVLQGVLLWSQEQGVGKSFVGDIMRAVYGDNASRVEKEDIVGQWTDWLVNKQFIHGEEITGDRSRVVADKVKNLVTRPTVRSNVKYQASFELEDRANYYLTSNHADSLHLEPQDRRWLVVHVDRPAMPEPWYNEIDDWLLKDDGPAHLFEYLLNEIDCSTYRPKGAAPATQAKADMAELSKSSLQMQIEALFDDPKAFLKFGKLHFERDVYTTSEILSMLGYSESECKKLLNPAAGILRKRRVPYKPTTLRRLYAVRNQEFWRKAEAIQWSDNYELDFQPEKYTKEGLNK